MKGIEVESSLLMHEVLAAVLPERARERVVALSGPSFAREVAAGKPTAVTLACRDEAYAIAVQAALSSPLVPLLHARATWSASRSAAR